MEVAVVGTQRGHRGVGERRVEVLRSHIQDITDGLLDTVQANGEMDILADIAVPLPAIVTAELLGLPTSDWRQLTKWSSDFAQILGNFQHNPDRAAVVLRSLEEMLEYFRNQLEDHRAHPRDDLMTALISAEVDGDRLTDDEIIANTIVTMVGGQETTTNLIGNGILSLLRHPEQLQQLQADPALAPSAIEELLRFESPSQHTARLAPEDTELGGKSIRKRQAVIVVMGAANRDPERFPDPDRLDLSRADNRHVAFAWGGHFCFGAPLARIEGQITFNTLLRRMPTLHVKSETLQWRENMGLRGLKALPVTF